MSEYISEKIMVDRKTFDKVAKAIHRYNMEEISFEFLVGSCFPKIMDNIKEEMRRQYTLGYIEGQKEVKNV